MFHLKNSQTLYGGIMAAEKNKNITKNHPSLLAIFAVPWIYQCSVLCHAAGPLSTRRRRSGLAVRRVALRRSATSRTCGFRSFPVMPPLTKKTHRQTNMGHQKPQRPVDGQGGKQGEGNMQGLPSAQVNLPLPCFLSSWTHHSAVQNQQMMTSWH